MIHICYVIHSFIKIYTTLLYRIYKLYEICYKVCNLWICKHMFYVISRKYVVYVMHIQTYTLYKWNHTESNESCEFIQTNEMKTSLN